MISLEKSLVAASFNKEEKNKDGTNAVIMFFVHIVCFKPHWYHSHFKLSLMSIIWTELRLMSHNYFNLMCQILKILSAYIPYVCFILCIGRYVLFITTMFRF